MQVYIQGNLRYTLLPPELRAVQVGVPANSNVVYDSWVVVPLYRAAIPLPQVHMAHNEKKATYTAHGVRLGVPANDNKVPGDPFSARISWYWDNAVTMVTMVVMSVILALVDVKTCLLCAPLCIGYMWSKALMKPPRI